MFIAYHYGRVSAGADGSGGEGVERRTCIELFRAEVVRAVAQTAADGAALVPTEEKGHTEMVQTLFVSVLVYSFF